MPSQGCCSSTMVGTRGAGPNSRMMQPLSLGRASRSINARLVPATHAGPRLRHCPLSATLISGTPAPGVINKSQLLVGPNLRLGFSIYLLTTQTQLPCEHVSCTSPKEIFPCAVQRQPVSLRGLLFHKACVYCRSTKLPCNDMPCSASMAEYKLRAGRQPSIMPTRLCAT